MKSKIINITKTQLLAAPRLGLVAALLVLAAQTTVVRAGGGDDGNAGVLPPNSHPYGKSYGQWSAEHWKWLYSIQTATHPLFQDGNVDLSLHQPPGKVWFLGGTFSTTPAPGGVIGIVHRTGTVPAGKALFFPIIDWEQDNAVPPPDPWTTSTTAELRGFAKAAMDTATGIACEIDEVSVKGLSDVLTTKYRATSPVFTYVLPATDNVDQFFGFDITGPVPGAVADGIYLMLAPLPPGQHTIHFMGLLPGFALDITYNLTVQPKSKGHGGNGDDDDQD